MRLFAALRSVSALLIVLAACLSTRVQADDTSVTEAIINLPAADAWRLFTTAAGYESLGYAGADVNLSVGGMLKVSSNGPLGLAQERVLSFEPERMLATQSAAVPAGTPAPWSILYFQDLGKQMTHLRWVTLGWMADTNAATHKTEVEQARRKLFDTLIRRYAPQCELCKKEAAQAAAGK